MDGFADGSWLSPAFLVTIAIIVICVLIGYKRGFIKTVFDLAGMLIAVILTVLISPVVASMMKGSPSIYDSLHTKIEKHVHINFDAEGHSLSQYLDDLEVPDKVGDYLLDGGKTLEEVASSSVDAVNARIVDKLTVMAINCIAFILTLIVVMIVITIVAMVLDLVSKLPGINMLNKTLGIAAGAIEAYLILSVIGVIIMTFSTSDFGISAASQIASNPILSFIYKNNLLLSGITRIKGIL